MSENPPVITPGENGLVRVCCGDDCVTFQCAVQTKIEARVMPSVIRWGSVNPPMRVQFEEMLTPQLQSELADAPEDARLVIRVQGPGDALDLHEISDLANQVHVATGRETELRMVD